MFSTIVSPNNPRVKSAVALRESRVRRKQGEFLIDGFREILRARRCGFEFVEVFINIGKDAVSDERLDVGSVLVRSNVPNDRRGEFEQFLFELEKDRVPTIPLSSVAFEKLGFGDRDEGVIVVARSRTTSLSDLTALLTQKQTQTGESPLLAVIEGVEKPGNVGAILRSADGAGVDALIIAAEEYDVFNPNTIRGSLGAVFHAPIVVAPSLEILDWSRRLGIQRATALCDESIPYSQLDYKRPTMIILGSEAQGLSEIWALGTIEDSERELLKKIRLPMLGIADSLNVSNAAAILFYEARRVRSY